VNEWAGQPLPLSATCFHQGRLYVRLSGAQPAVVAAMVKLGGATVGDGDAFWMKVRDHAHVFFVGPVAAGTPLWRLSVKSTVPYADLGGEQLIEWGGALRWLAATERTDPQKVHQWAAAQGGHATLFRATAKDAGVFQPLDEALARLHDKLRSVFDPQRIFNRGRLLEDA
jgi:glycolate oxidase FAD binding subunit